MSLKLTQLPQVGGYGFGAVFTAQVIIGNKDWLEALPDMVHDRLPTNSMRTAVVAGNSAQVNKE